MKKYKIYYKDSQGVSHVDYTSSDNILTCKKLKECYQTLKKIQGWVIGKVVFDKRSN